MIFHSLLVARNCMRLLCNFAKTFKGAIKAPKIQRDLFCFCVQTDRNYDALNYNSLYRVHLTVVVNKSGFVCPET